MIFLKEIKEFSNGPLLSIMPFLVFANPLGSLLYSSATQLNRPRYPVCLGILWTETTTKIGYLLYMLPTER